MAEQITVRVDSDVADFYRSASDAERRKLDLLVSLRLREFANGGRSPARNYAGGLAVKRSDVA